MLETHHPRQRAPAAVWCLLGITGAVYVVSIFLPLSYEDAVQFGTVADRPQLLGLLASLFLHVNGMHLLFNASLLWLFGRDVEEVLGSAAFLVVYLVIGVAAQLAQIGAMHLFLLSDEGMPILGASGAVSGVMGAFAAWFPRARIVLQSSSSKNDSRSHPLRFYAAWIWGGWMAVQIAWMGWSTWGYPVQMAVWGHGAGFIMGLALAALYSRLGSPATEIFLASKGGEPIHSASTSAHKRPLHPSELKMYFLQAEQLESRGESLASRDMMEQALFLAVKSRASAEALTAYRWLADRGWLREIAPERRLEISGLLENSGQPEGAMEVLQGLLPDASPEIAASALLSVARIFAGPMNDSVRAEEALRMIDMKYSQTRAALLTMRERQRLNSVLKADN